jgi:hypothetical protein
MRLFVALLSVVALVFAAPAVADAPTEFPILEVFDDVNPCTGEVMTVTFVGTAFVHEHGSRIVVHAARTITTSDGFVGHGTDTFVDNGQVFKFSQTDILTNAASGQRFRARVLVVGDVATETVRIERFSLTCLGRS